jgi:hypothetical protein
VKRDGLVRDVEKTGSFVLLMEYRIRTQFKFRDLEVVLHVRNLIRDAIE